MSRATPDEGLLLAIDQGTTSSRALLFDQAGRPFGAIAQQELPQHFPAPGLVEHDPEDIWRSTCATCRQALESARRAGRPVVAVGLTNQRETVVLWERDGGRPLHRALVWQDRRGTGHCERLAARGCAELVQQRTGLLLDPYFSATKLAWLLDHVDGARRQAERGELLAGTIDSFLVWRLTQGRVHATDASNASRTLLFDIHAQRWDDELLELFDVPREILPEVRDSAGDFGSSAAEVLGVELPILGVAGDQQAAALGQACWQAGTSKCTYGTGAFALLNTGGEAPRSRHRLLTTVAYRLDGRVSYALEGSIFSAGSTLQWLRDGLGLLRHAADSARMAARSDRSRRVHLVPAFTGLGAPDWDARARGAILGLTRDVTADDIVRAALEAVAFQTADLFEAMAAEGAPLGATLRVDGGMARNDWLMQCVADLLGRAVERPVVTETTALGAALLAARGAGLCPAEADLCRRWTLERAFEPRGSDDERRARRADWRAAVDRVRSERTP